MKFKSIASFKGHTGLIQDIAITPNNRKLASLSQNKIFVWDLETKQRTLILEGHSDTIMSLCISPDGRLIVSGSLDKTTKVWNIETGELIHTLALNRDPIYSVAFSPDNKLIASGGASKYKCDRGKKTRIYLWNLDGELVDILSGHELRINQLAFNYDGTSIVSASNDGTVKVWNIASGKEFITIAICLLFFAFAPNENSLVTSGADGLEVWNLDAPGQTVSTVHPGKILGHCTISPDGVLAYASRESIQIYSLPNLELLQTLECSHPYSIKFSQDGTKLIAGCSGWNCRGFAQVWQVL